MSYGYRLSESFCLSFNHIACYIHSVKKKNISDEESQINHKLYLFKKKLQKVSERHIFPYLCNKF